MTIHYRYITKDKYEEQTLSNCMSFPANEKEYIFKILSFLKKENPGKKINMEILKIEK
jgi:hypothetical protein